MIRFLTTVQSSLSTRLTLWLGGRWVGADMFGNRYYTMKPKRGLKRERRFVLYAQEEADASHVPPEWHGWLHHQTNDIPSDVNPLRREWQQPYQPNKTGTLGAYMPSGHIQAGGERDSATGDYQAWTPNS